MCTNILIQGFDITREIREDDYSLAQMESNENLLNAPSQLWTFQL